MTTTNGHIVCRHLLHFWLHLLCGLPGPWRNDMLLPDPRMGRPHRGGGEPPPKILPPRLLWLHWQLQCGVYTWQSEDHRQRSAIAQVLFHYFWHGFTRGGDCETWYRCRKGLHECDDARRWALLLPLLMDPHPYITPILELFKDHQVLLSLDICHLKVTVCCSTLACEFMGLNFHQIKGKEITRRKVH